MQPANPPGEIEFDSCFESGNLDLAAAKSPGEYDLFMRTDGNTRGHHQWFFFSVKDKAPATARFNILNFTKADSLYALGMRVAVFSQRKAELASRGELEEVFADWHRGGENIEYGVSKMSSEGVKSKSLYMQQWATGLRRRKKKLYYGLSFDYRFEYPNDTVYFAYSVPYTFTQLTSFLDLLRAEHNSAAPGPTAYMKQSVLCRTLSGLDIPLLTITSNLTAEEDTSDRKKKKRPTVVVTARIHPGETCGSLMMHGFLRLLVSPQGQGLRDRILFKVVPMLNPDGVILGNYRAGLSGQDLNRKFLEPDPRLHPEICAIKAMIEKLKNEGREILGYIDLHAHSKKKCVFIYGPYYPLHAERYVQVRVFAKLLASRTQMFRYKACKYRLDKDKLSAARLVLSREFDIMNSFTLEASFYGYIDSERKTVEFRRDFYELMGRHLADTLLEYTQMLDEERQLRLHRMFLKRSRRTKQSHGEANSSVTINPALAATILACTKTCEDPRHTEPAEETKPKGRLVRVEDAYRHPELPDAKSKEKITPQKRLREIYASIQEEADDMAACSDSDSDSAESENDPSVLEAEQSAVKTILLAIEGFARSSSPQVQARIKGSTRERQSAKTVKRRRKRLLPELFRSRNAKEARLGGGFRFRQKLMGTEEDESHKVRLAMYITRGARNATRTLADNGGSLTTKKEEKRQVSPGRGGMRTVGKRSYYRVLPFGYNGKREAPTAAEQQKYYIPQIRLATDAMRIPAGGDTRNGLKGARSVCVCKRQNIVIANYQRSARVEGRSGSVSKSYSLSKSRAAGRIEEGGGARFATNVSAEPAGNPVAYCTEAFVPANRVRRSSNNSSVLRGRQANLPANALKEEKTTQGFAYIEAGKRFVRRSVMRPNVDFRRLNLFPERREAGARTLPA